MTNKFPEPTDADTEDLFATQKIVSSDKLRPGELLAGRFEIIALQGSGRYGCVYLAEDKQLQTRVALKLLHQEQVNDPLALNDFKREILLLRQLTHPNILRVHEYYQDGERHFLTMDWIEGETLQNKLEQGELSDQQIASIARQLLEGLAFAQQNNVLHRDIKPDNLLLDGEGKLFIADFGMAAIAKSDQSGIKVGTPFYETPEQLQFGKYSASTDLYAAGVILYQLCCGKLPFEATDFEGLIRAKLAGPDKFKPVRKELACYKTLLLTLLAPYPEQRPQEALKALEELQRALNPEQKSVFRPWFTGGILALVCCLIVWTWWPAQKETEKAFHALAILPFYGEGDEARPWLDAGLSDFIAYQLQQEPKIRLVDNQRIRETMELLGLKGALKPQELALVADLLQVDNLVATKVIASKGQEPVLVTKLYSLEGQGVVPKDMYRVELNRDDMDATASKLLTHISKQLELEMPAQIEAESGAENVLLYSQVSRLIGEQKWQDAEVKLTDQLAQTPQQANLYFRLAGIYRATGESYKAEQALKDTIKYAKPQQLVYQLASAELHLVSGQLEEAKQVYLKLLPLFPYNTEIRFALSEVYLEEQAFSDAESVLQEVVSIDPNHPSAWFELAKVAIWSGESQKAIDEYLVRALVIAKRLKDVFRQGDILNAMGVAYQRLGELPMALDYYRQGLLLREKVQDKSAMATSLSNLATVYGIRGEYALAMSNLERSLDLYQEVDDPEGKANTYNELGILAEEQGHYSEALEYYRQALNLRMDLNDEWLSAESMNNIGYIYFLLADPEHARVYWLQAEQAYKKVQDPVGVVRVRENLGQMELGRGNWRQAFRLFSDARKQAQEMNLTEELLVADAYLARLSFLQGNFVHSISSLQSVFEVVEEREDVRGINEFGLWIADWWSQIGNTGESQRILQKIAALIKDKGSAEQRMYFSLLESQNQYYAGQTSLADAQGAVKELADNIPQQMRITYLLHYARQMLNTGSGQFEELVNQLRRQNLEMHRYQEIALLELEAAYNFKNANWQGLEKTLRDADKAMHKLENYWRKFQFTRMRSLLEKQRGGDAVTVRQQAVSQFAQLLDQIPTENRTRFMEMQDYIDFGDAFMKEVQGAK